MEPAIADIVRSLNVAEIRGGFAEPAERQITGSLAPRRDNGVEAG